MKRFFLLAALLLASQTLLSADEGEAKESNWHTEAELGASVPLKLIYTGSQKSKGFSAQLEGLYRARTDKGLAFFAGAAAGPFFTHPRCGTSFMFNVLAISIIIYTVIGIFTGAQPAWVNVAIRLVAIPIICSISYEILRFVGRHDRNWLCKLMSKPGLWLQKFTTEEPDGPIVEVAIASMQAVIPENKDDDNW